MKKKIIGLIPTRLNSTRLPQKALMEIEGMPLVIHTYKRAKLSKLLDDVFICCDDKKIAKIASKFGAKAVLTSKNHQNGTERICEAYTKIEKKYKFDFIVDIQGDEPLISPFHIDKVISAHIKNKNADIILPTLKVKRTNNTNIVKVVSNKLKEVMYISRANIPFEFKTDSKFHDKHLSIISFKPEALKKYSSFEKSKYELIEDVELLRALEIGLKIKTISLKGDSFSVDIFDDLVKARKKIKLDKIYKLYK